MRRVVVGIVAIVLVLVAGLAAAPFLLPDSVLRRIAESAASAVTGRDLAIEGPFHVRVWPPLALEAGQVRLADAPWTGRQDMATVARFELSLDALALFDGLVRIERLVLERPEITFERDATGRSNWQPAKAEGSGAGPASGGDGGGLPRLLLDEVTIVDGRIRLVDRAAGTTREIRGLDLRLEGGGTGGVLTLDGRAVVEGEPVVLQGRLPDPDRLVASGEGPLDLTLTAPGGSLRASGQVRFGPDGAAVALGLHAGFPRPGDTLAWLAVEPGTAAGTFGRFAFDGTLEADLRHVSLKDAVIGLDAIVLHGAAEADLTRARPWVEATFSTGVADLDPYLPPEAPSGETGAPAAADRDGAWPDDPIRLPLPLPVDLALALEFEGLRARGLVLGAGTLAVRTDGPKAHLLVPHLALYGGSARADWTLEAGERLRVEGELELADVALHPFLVALAGFDRLEGTGDARAELRSGGRNVRDLVSALEGAGEVRLRDGAIRGIDIGAMVRQVTSPGRAGGEGRRKTDFAELGATFTITDGVLVSRDLVLRAPLLRLAGEGRVDLPARTLDWRIEPRIASTLEGQGASGEPAFAAGIPVRIEGPWSDPQWSFEFGDGIREVIRDPEQIGALVEKLRGNPEVSGRIRERLEGALGGLSGAGAAGEGPDAAPPAGGGRTAPRVPLPDLPGGAGDLLRGLIGR